MIQQCTSRYIKELTGGSQRVIHSPTFRTALLTLAKTLKQLNCPLMDEYISKMWYTPMMHYYSALERKEFMTYATPQMNFEYIMLRESSQT
jgi:hypothetical protein